jgi:hypothetical protein
MQAIVDHTQQHQKPKASDEDERVRAMAALIDPLGVDADSYFALEGPPFGAASAASDTFYTLRGNQRGLEQALMHFDDEARGTLHRVFALEDNALRPNDGWKRRLLATASEEVERNWGVVMLMPNGPYERGLRSLVEQLEPDNANEILPSEEKLLLSTAQTLVNALESNARESGEDWMQLEALFNQLARVPSQQVVSGDVKRTLN